MKHVDVVIISWARNEELLQITKNGLDSLFESENDVTFHAYVVESNKDIRYEDMREYQMKWMHSIKTIHPEEEFGYHKYLNIGRRAGNSPYIVLCNSDLTYENNWASNIIKVMETLPRFLSASPWCPQTQGSNQSNLENIFEGYRVRGELAGWCIFQQRKIYDKIGELDERFSFWYCDNDYSLELQKNGISHCLVPSSVVNHHEKNLGKTGETLTESDQRKITVEQEAVFMNKWRNFIK
jgi:GT2 family glycosyltransferase